MQDVVNVIFDFLDLNSQINFKSTSHNFNKLNITNLCDFNMRINQNFIDDHTSITHLNLHLKYQIFKINHLTKLLYLNMGHGCAINNNQLTNLKNLTWLDARSNAGFNTMRGYDHGELNLANLTNLIYLNAAFMINISHLTKLKTLKIHKSVITNEDISLLTNLTCLNISSNQILTNLNLNFCYQLTSLDISYTNIASDGITALTNLISLCIYDSQNIKDFGTLTNLQTLEIYDVSGVTNDGITNLTNLTSLLISNNTQITNLNIFTSLTNLQISEASSITNNNITNLTNLTYLNLNENSQITNINSLIHLNTLRAAGYECILDDEGITNLSNLTSLDIYNNVNIRNIQNYLHIKDFTYGNSYDDMEDGW